MRVRAAIIVVMLLLTACSGIGRPQVTPTVAPTRTYTPIPTEVVVVPSRTPIPSPTYTSTSTLTAVPTLTSTSTFTPTDTLTSTPTNTDEPTATDTYTPIPTATFTQPPSPTASSTPTITPLPTLGFTATQTPSSTPTETYTPTSTLTPLPTATNTPVPPTPTPAPTDTLPPDLTGTARALITDTPNVPPTALATTPAPTLDVTPTFVTAAAETEVAPDVQGSVTPIIGDATIEVFEDITSTPTFAPTVADVPVFPTVSINDPALNTQPVVISRAFVLSPGGGQAFTTGGNITNPTLFIRNPIDPTRYIATDSLGLMFTLDNGQQNRPTTSPFTDFAPESREANNANVVNAAWSPDGRAVAFIVDSWSVDGSATSDDGVWYYIPGETVPRQLFVHCPRTGLDQCQITQIPGMPYEYVARSLVWSQNNELILIEADAFDVGRRALFVLTRDQDRSNRPHALFYDYGDWALDGRIVVSGRRPADNRVILGLVNPDGSGEEIRLDGSAAGLWLQNGVQLLDGRLAALGRPGDPNGAMQIYDQNGTALTGFIGETKPVVAKWNPERDRVYVQTEDGRKFMANINGSITEITDVIGSIGAVDWVSGRLPPAVEVAAISAPPGGTTAEPANIPAGVVEGSRYQAGQQLRVQYTVLNIRQTPSLNGGIAGVLNFGDFVAIVAGPVMAENIEWWQIKAANGVTGWIAGQIGDASTLAP